MKKTLSINKLLETIKKHKGLFIGIILILLFSAVAYASFVVINPGLDKEAVKKGEEQLKSLNIIIDEKTIKELKEEKAPTVINGAAGRNPFTPL